MNVCGRGDEYVEGLLSPDEEQAFLSHLTACVRCQGELEVDTQLRAVEDRLRVEGAPFLERLRSWWRRLLSEVDWARPRGGPLAIALPLAAVVIAVVYVGFQQGRGVPPPALVLAERRSFEGRVTYAAADRHRPYDASRGGSDTPSDETPTEVLGELSRRGDYHGVATGYLLRGDLKSADRHLSRARRSPDIDSDRALLAMFEHRWEDALSLLDEVLRGVPDHRQALWNRGLVLREMGLSLTAAESFARVAALDPEWREEALERARSLREQDSELRDAWWAARRAGYEMVDGGPPLPPEVARRFPGMVRVFFHDALRLAPSGERVDALLPLAEELDRAYGGNDVSAAIARARGWSFEARRPLLGDYLDFVHGRSTLDDAGWRRWLAGARSADAGDLILGALILTGRAGGHLDELRQAARKADSPWFELIAATEEAKAVLRAGERDQGERLLTQALERCQGLRAPFRCLGIEDALVRLNLLDHRLQAASKWAVQALERARRINEWGHVKTLIEQMGELERLRSRFAQARAYYEESALGGSAEHCETARDNRLNLAALYGLERRFGDARREAEAAPACGSPLLLTGLLVHLDLYRTGRPVLSEDVLRRHIEDLRRRPNAPRGERLFTDYAEARLLIDRDPTRGEALLRAVIDEAARLPGDALAAKVRSYAYTMLLTDAARRGAFDRMAPLLVEEQGGGEPAGPCTIVIARDDLRLAAAAWGREGALVGHYDEHSLGEGPTPLAPKRLLNALAGCPAVRVLAQPPLVGAPRLLPPEWVWSYDVGARNPAPDFSGMPRRVIVSGAIPPQERGLPSLEDRRGPDGVPGTVPLRGYEANPSRVLAEIVDAAEIQFHVHTASDRRLSDVPVLALTPDATGDWALTAERIRTQPLRRHPVVLLADCRAGEMAGLLHDAWGLPTAFLAAGASAVVAPPVDVPDSEATRFFDEVSRRIRAGEPPAAAVAAERRAWVARHPDGGWGADVIVFE